MPPSAFIMTRAGTGAVSMNLLQQSTSDDLEHSIGHQMNQKLSHRESRVDRGLGREEGF